MRRKGSKLLLTKETLRTIPERDLFALRSGSEDPSVVPCWDSGTDTCPIDIRRPVLLTRTCPSVAC